MPEELNRGRVSVAIERAKQIAERYKETGWPHPGSLGEDGRHEVERAITSLNDAVPETFPLRNPDGSPTVQKWRSRLGSDAAGVSATLVRWLHGDAAEAMTPKQCLGVIDRMAMSAADNLPLEVSKPIDESGTRDQADASTPKQKPTRRERRAKWLAEAMLTVRDHPEWSDATIAEQVGIDKSRLSRSPEYQAAARMARSSRMPGGSVTITDKVRILDAADDSFNPNRLASRQSSDEEDTDDRIDREMNETQRNPQRGRVKTPVNRRSSGA